MMDLYRVKLAQTHAKSPQDVISDFGYPVIFKFRVDNAFRDIYRFELSKIRSAVNILSEADLLLKSATVDGVVLLETSIIKMMEKT
jgi:DNA polymerase III delta subunit